MKSTTTRHFREMFHRLPREVQTLARKQYTLFNANPNHPGLEFKRVHRNPPVYSARVGIHHRALARLDGDDLIWFWIGPHHEYDHLLRQL